ncbi:hypothetical protein EC396_15030 [Lutibacter sp. HS1-25]|uniref:type IX secretion system protein PorG n=1 Tax=Lutibacter sp. HS1-25 TaxID=2485000 RepID=UPI001011695B|nr:DUF6089 family protein [Lutibacter sp. HS1-25]RXP45898.1 hypothetical protein EC396_15030 [Lutibacter sp. HS1-25]
MKKLIYFISFICITTVSKAQIHEIGVFAGGSNYIGDIGSELYINPTNLMGGIIYKYNLNPRMALRGTFTYAKISADDAKASNIGRQQRGLRFSNTLTELAAGIEYSYFPYNLNTHHLTQTPYILLEIAALNFNNVIGENGPLQYQYGSKTTVAIPFGLGYKFKVARGFAMAFEIRTTYTFTDELDYNNSKIPALTFGNPNNNDWYTFTGVSFVYTFGRPPCYATPY